MKRDARELDHKTLEEFRFRSIECIQAGERPDLIARILGVDVSSVYKWKRLFEKGGWEALQAVPIPGRPRTLDSETEKWIAEAVSSETPQSWGFPTALRTRSIVREIIEERSAVRLSEVSAGKMLRRLGISPHRPLTRAYEQDPQAVEQWVAQDFPALRERAQAEDAQIFFGDESGFRSDYHSGTTWAPVGETPVVLSTGKSYRWNMLSAVSSRGEMQFMVRDAKEGCVNSTVFIEFLERLIVGAPAKIFLVLDNASIHHSQATRSYVRSVADRLELHFLPPYAPELNPDELVGNQVKNHTLGERAFRNKTDLQDALSDAFEALAQAPEKICSFFRKNSTRYAY